MATAAGGVFSRAGSDTNISNTPAASNEYSHLLFSLNAYHSVVVWLSASLTADFAVSSTDNDLYISYPREYML